ncbi:MAG: hypothetical protein ACRD5H_02840 [Nitrososphaerales archaeon]
MAVIVSVSMELAPLDVYDLAIAVAVISRGSTLICYFRVEYGISGFVHGDNCSR